MQPACGCKGPGSAGLGGSKGQAVNQLEEIRDLEAEGLGYNGLGDSRLEALFKQIAWGEKGRGEKVAIVGE